MRSLFGEIEALRYGTGLDENDGVHFRIHAAAIDAVLALFDKENNDDAG